VTLDAAQSRLNALGARLAAAFPHSNRDKSFLIRPIRQQQTRQVRTTLWMLMGAVGLLLLIACANVANLLLARAGARSREVAVRAALGGIRIRIARQLLVESAMLALAGGAAGLWLAWAATGALVALAPPNLPVTRQVDVDLNVLLFVTLVSLGARVLFGLAPWWHSSRLSLAGALKQGGTRGLLGTGSQRLRNTLVVAEGGLAVVLATGATLLARSLIALGAAHLGYWPERVLVMYAHHPARTLEENLAATRFFDRLIRELETIPGVKSAAGAMGVPAGRYGSNGLYAVEGKHRLAAGEPLPEAGFRLAGPGYFSTMGIPLLRGRVFPLAISTAALRS
jgi:predicted permease